MRTVAAFMTCLLCGLTACAGQLQAVADLVPPVDCAASIGNGGLTIAVNGHGRITSCLWPSPGYNDQITYGARRGDAGAVDAGPADGLMWGVRAADRTYWLAGDPWRAEQSQEEPGVPVLTTVAAIPEQGIEAVQRLFVHPKLDVLVSRLEVKCPAAAPELVWYANFTPCTRTIPELPIGDWLLDPLNDFAVFTADQGRTIRHFRPAAPQSRHWEEAELLAASGGGQDEWAGFNDGVYIAYSSPDRLASFQCGTEDGESCAFTQASQGNLAGASAAVGQCNSAISLIPTQTDGVYVATVCVAFGETPAESRETLDASISKGYGQLLAETTGHWRERVAAASWPVADSHDFARQCLLAMLISMDRETGAIVRTPVAQPPCPLDLPQCTAFATLALDLAGYAALADKHVRFALDGVREQDAPGAPVGSVPVARYANGTDALPMQLLDARAAAWTLWSCGRHAAALEPKASAEFLAKTWDKIDLAASFLTAWADGRTGEPLHSFDQDLLRDSQTDDLLVTTYLGVGSACDLASLVDKDRPEWVARLGELDDIIRARRENGGDAWTPGPLLALATRGADSSVDAMLTGQLSRLNDLDPDSAALLVCIAAMTWENRPEKLAELRPSLDVALRKALGVVTVSAVPGGGVAPMRPDTYRAALCYVAARMILGSDSDAG